MSHHGMQSSLTCLPVLTTRQQCLFPWAIFFRRMCMRICYVPFCATQYHSCRTIQVFEITYQENWTGHFVLVYAHNGCHDWMAFLVSLLKTKRSLLNVSLHIVLSIEKCWLAGKCHLNNVLQNVIKIINHIKVHALNSWLFAQLCEMDTERTSSLIHRSEMLSKGRSLARVFELWETFQRLLLEKWSPLAAYFNDTEWVTKFP